MADDKDALPTRYKMQPCGCFEEEVRKPKPRSQRTSVLDQLMDSPVQEETEGEVKQDKAPEPEPEFVWELKRPHRCKPFRKEPEHPEEIERQRLRAEVVQYCCDVLTGKIVIQPRKAQRSEDDDAYVAPMVIFRGVQPPQPPMLGWGWDGTGTCSTCLGLGVYVGPRGHHCHRCKGFVEAAVAPPPRPVQVEEVAAAADEKPAKRKGKGKGKGKEVQPAEAPEAKPAEALETKPVEELQAKAAEVPEIKPAEAPEVKPISRKAKKAKASEESASLGLFED